MKTHRTALISILALTILGCGDDDPTKPNGDGTLTPGAPEQVTIYRARHPDVSPNGLRLAMDLTGPGAIATASLDGSQLDTLALGFTAGPDWSPDGSRIVVDAGGVLALIEVATKQVSTLGTGDIDGNPDWAPDGSKIAARTTAGSDGIGITTYPAGAWSVLPCVDQNGGTCDGEDPSWAPDGSAIAFEDGLEILRVPSAGGTATVVAQGFPDVTEPAWSPDGRWIAFVADSSAAPAFGTYSHIWIADSRGQQHGLLQVTFGPFVDRQPAWGRDSRTIFFSSDRPDSVTIWKVRLQ